MLNSGVFIPLITPLDEQGAVCPKSVGQLLACSHSSVSGYIPCLTSGEGWKLDAASWEAMVGHTVEHAKGRAVIAGIERSTTDEVLSYIDRSRQLGAVGVMVTSPFGDVTQEAILLHYQKIHDACGDLKLFIYNESALSGNETSFETLLTIAHMPRVVGIKDSVESGREAQQVEAFRRCGLAYYIGWEALLATEQHSDGNVVSLANLEPAICRMATNGVMPSLQSLIGEFVESYSLLSEDWYRYVKTILRERGVIQTDLLVVTPEEQG